MRRQALGKGLSSLIPEPVPRQDPGFIMLDVDRIQPNPYQPRSEFADLEQLAGSIRDNGMVQPIVVRREAGSFRLVAGERRWRAARIAGVRSIPAVVRAVPDDRLLELALIENLQRKGLNPIEEAKAYEVLVGRMRLSQAEVAKRVGRDRSSVANSLRILRLPGEVQDLLREGSLSVGHTKVLMAIADAGTQIRVAREIVRNLLSVREAEQKVAEALRGSGGRRRTSAAPQPDPNVRAAEDRLRRALGTKVRIVKKGARGRIEIDFYSEAELDRLYGFLLTAEKGH
ncbi:MAG: ParB/RepB/Spo0J family partition protein [Acidobacteriota bacterium]